MNAYGFAQGLQVITTLETRNEPSVAATIRPLLQRVRHVNKIFICQTQLAQRIAEMRIKARRDND